MGVYQHLSFSTSPLRNGLVEGCIVVVTVPVLAAAIFFGLRAVRWGLLGVWPAPIGIAACHNELVMQLGPFGTQSYDASCLQIRYPYELDDDQDGDEFEAFLPEDVQVATLLPRITHSRESKPLNHRILRFTGASEADLAQVLLPITRAWREQRADMPVEGISDQA